MAGMWHEAEDYAAYMGEGRTDEPKVCAHGIADDDVCEDCEEEAYQRELQVCDRCGAHSTSLTTMGTGHDPTDYDEQQWCDRCVEWWERRDDFSYSPDCP